MLIQKEEQDVFYQYVKEDLREVIKESIKAI